MKPTLIHLAAPHRSQRDDYPTPPKGYALIATEADRMAAGKKQRGDKVWSSRSDEWVNAVLSTTFRESLVYARKLEK